MPSLPFLAVTVTLIPLLCRASPINRQVGLSDNVFMTTQNGTDGLEQRVCSIDAVTYLDGETIPTSSPCEHCVCRPPGFACTITSCEYRPGCKAFRRSDQCCPEYQCECEKDGKIYQNGEKIMDNNNPCEVCYCQGGEIICAVIDCYWRNDCAPRYIDNRCCPMYDHCPPPSAQGPIRHRLPSVPSLAAPISWHNLTQPVAPTTTSTTTTTTTTTTTEAPTTTASTTVSTTSEVPSSTVGVEENEVEVPIQSDNVEHDEPVKVNDVISESSSVIPPVETTQQSGIDGVNADQPISHDDHVDEPQEPIAPSSVSSAVIESTTFIIPAAIELTIQPSSVNQIHIIGSIPPVPAVHVEPVPEQIVTTSEPDSNLVQNDSIPEERHDQVDIEATTVEVEKAMDDEIHTTENVVSANQDGSALRNEQEDNSENVVASDEPATTVPPVKVVSPIELTRNDLVEASTQADLEASEGIVTTPVSVPGGDKDEIFADAVEETTPRLEVENVQNDEPEYIPRGTLPPPQFDDAIAEVSTSGSVQHDDVETATQNNEIAFDDHVHDEVTEAHFDATEPPVINDFVSDDVSHDMIEAEAVFNDHTEVAVEAQNDATEAPHISHDDANEVDPISHDDTTDTAPISHDDVTENVPVSNDDIVTGTPVHYNAVSFDVTEIPHDEIYSDSTNEPEPLQDEVAVTERSEQEEQIVQDATEGNFILHDDNDVTETQFVSHDEPTESYQFDDVTENVVHDEVVNDEPQVVNDATEKVEVVHDEPEALEDATEKVQSDQVNTERPSQDVVQNDDPAASTSATEIVEPHSDDAFDIILDDEVVPEKIEVLNQVRDVNEIEEEHKPIMDDVHGQNSEILYEGVRFADNDTVEIINLSALPDKQPVVEETTQVPVEVSSASNIVNDETSTDEAVEFVNDDIANDESQQEVVQTTTSEHLVLNDESSPEIAPETVSDSANVVKEGIFLSDDRLFRTDIFRHHMGVPHDDEEITSTTTLPIVSSDEPAEEIVRDATVAPEEITKNKVQKVAEATHKVPESGEITENKFRLELDVFRGSNEVLPQDEEKADEIPATASILADDVEVTTQSVQQRDDIVVVQNENSVTERAIVQDEVATASNDEDDANVLQDEQVTEVPTFVNDEPFQSTSFPVHDEADQSKEIAQDESVTSAYSFRMDILGSHEETAVEQHDDAPATQSPQHISQDDNVVPGDDGIQVVNDEVTGPPSISENEINHDQVVTETPSKLRSDINLPTETPVFSDVVEQVTNGDQPEPINDYVEVSTSSSSGFGLEFRDDATVRVNDATDSPSNDGVEAQDDSTQANELRSDPVEDATVNVVENEVQHDDTNINVIFADEVVTTSQPVERLRTDPAEVQSLQDEPVTTTESPTNNTSSENPRDRARDEIVLPERGVPKIQPISPDLTRSNANELGRFDLQLPPEKDNSWLSRAVNQFRRLTLFGGEKRRPGPTKTRMYNHRFLLF